MANIKQALTDRGVVVFRGQDLAPAEFVAFSRSLGELEAYGSTVGEFLMPDHPEIIIISNVVENGRQIGVRDAGQFWHTDRSYVSRPGWASSLYAREVPRAPDGASLGQTMYANMIAACAALDPAERSRLQSLKGWHEYVYRFTTRKAHQRLPGVEQPVILKHPLSGKPSLYVNEGFTHRIAGLPEDQSKALLDQLFAHATRPEFIYTHCWDEGDVVLWDNYSVQHRAVSNYTPEQRRLLWRTTISGFDLVQ